LFFFYLIILFGALFAILVFSPAFTLFYAKSSFPPKVKSPIVKELEASQVESIGRVLYGVCNSLWVEMRKDGCPGADDPYVVWSFLRGYSTLQEALDRCTPSPVLDCARPERYGCYLLKRALSSGKSEFLSKTVKDLSEKGVLQIDYDRIASSSDSYSDPCAVEGTLFGEDK